MVHINLKINELKIQFIHKSGVIPQKWTIKFKRKAMVMFYLLFKIDQNLLTVRARTVKLEYKGTVEYVLY
jgi:hypothetical protein